MFKIFYIIYILLISISNTVPSEVSIQFKIDNEIVTNVDIEKEYRYLTALNTSLQSLEKNKAYQIAKTSLIKEIIKKNELKKYYNLNQDSQYMTRIVKNFYENLGIKDKKEFENYLIKYEINFSDIKKK